MNKEIVHLISVILWAIYGIVIGSLVIYYHYSSSLAWISVIAAITGNSAHLISLSMSKTGLTIQNPQEPPKP